MTAAVRFFIFANSTATTGLLNTLTYPKSTSSFALTLEYGYGYGLLQSITDTSDTTETCGTTCVLWTANAQNGFGEVTQETLGNGVVTNRSYDAVTSWLTRRPPRRSGRWVTFTDGTVSRRPERKRDAAPKQRSRAHRILFLRQRLPLDLRDAV